MPNWCENEVMISGPRELVDTVVTRLASADHHGHPVQFNFDALIPYPEEFRGSGSQALREAWITENKDKVSKGWTVPDGYNLGGYDWCCKNWGTKWGAGEVTRTDKPSKNPHRRVVHYRFDTAWAPPLPVIEQLAREYPDLRIELKYWEGGMGFKGLVRFKAGQCVQEDHSEYRGHRGG